MGRKRQPFPPIRIAPSNADYKYTSALPLMSLYEEWIKAGRPMRKPEPGVISGTERQVARMGAM